MRLAANKFGGGAPHVNRELLEPYNQFPLTMSTKPSPPASESYPDPWDLNTEEGRAAVPRGWDPRGARSSTEYFEDVYWGSWSNMSWADEWACRELNGERVPLDSLKTTAIRKPVSKPAIKPESK